MWHIYGWAAYCAFAAADSFATRVSHILFIRRTSLSLCFVRISKYSIQILSCALLRVLCSVGTLPRAGKWASFPLLGRIVRELWAHLRTIRPVEVWNLKWCFGYLDLWSRYLHCKEDSYCLTLCGFTLVSACRGNKQYGQVESACQGFIENLSFTLPACVPERTLLLFSL